MPSFKTAKTEALFAELAAKFINRESSGQGLITVTGAKESNKGRMLTIFVTVLPTNREHAALDFLSRKKREFGAYVSEQAKLRFLPGLAFALDLGEKNRQRLDELLQREDERRSGEVG